MNTTQDILFCNINNNNNTNGLMIDESEKNATFLLTQKVDEVTGNQMKKIEVQKMEDDLTIKMLEREYLEDKRNFIYSKQKLEETRKKASTQSEMINQLLQANKAILEKFNELKRFQREFIILNVNNAEKSCINSVNKNSELSNILEIIIEKENYSKCANKTIFNKKTKLNSDIQKQIKEGQTNYDNLNKILKQSKKKVEVFKTQLIQEKINKNFQDLIEENKKKIIQLEACEEVFQKQIQQEIDDLLQEKKKKLQNLDIINKIVEEKQEFSSKFESELLLIEKHEIALNENLKTSESKNKTIFNDAMRRRDNSEVLKKVFDENIKNIKSEQNKIDIELKITKTEFSKDENDMHKEFNNLLAKMEIKKKLLKEIESYQRGLNKLNETKQVKQKEISTEKELQDNLKKLTDKVKKHEQIILNKNKKMNELNKKIETFQEKKSNIEQKLKSTFNNEVHIHDDILTKPSEINLRNALTDKKLKQSANSQNKLSCSPYETENDSSDINKISYFVNKTILKSPSKKSIYSFDLDETDESDDELNTKNIMFKKIEEPNINSQKTVINNIDQDHENNVKLNNSQLQSDKIFDNLLSQKTFKSSKTIKDTGLFKVPQTYMTPLRRKTLQSKKYF